MSPLTYADIIERLKALNTPIEHGTLQNYVRNAIIEKPSYELPGGPAHFTTRAPLQVYAAKMMTIKWIRSTTVKEAREIVEYVEGKFEPVKDKKKIALLEDALLKDDDLIALLIGNSEGAFRAWEWAELKLGAAEGLMNYDHLDADPSTWLMDAQEHAEYADIHNNLALHGGVIDFLKKYRGELVTLANGFKLQSKSTRKSNYED